MTDLVVQGHIYIFFYVPQKKENHTGLKQHDLGKQKKKKYIFWEGVPKNHLHLHNQIMSFQTYKTFVYL